jgi:hypothetical protein
VAGHLRRRSTLGRGSLGPRTATSSLLEDDQVQEREVLEVHGAGMGEV